MTRRHKVVLYNPRAVFYTMPLALVAVGSHLDPERYEVVIVDGRLEADPAAAVRAHLDGALCLGVTVLTGAPIADAVAVSRAAKAHSPGLPVVWGGWHPSMFGRECLEEPSVDVTVQAQGEITFHEICDRLAAGESLEGCPGCVVRTAGGEVRQNPPRPLQDLNRLRPHDYRLLPVERYYDLKGKRQLDYISSQGCAFRCAFCADPFVYNRKWVGLEPERMGEEIETLWRRYRFDDLSFQDETYFTYAPRVEAVADEFLRRGLPITWAATMRADQGERLPDEVMAKCKRSGLRRVIIGVESGSQEMMDRIKKDIKLEQVFESAEKCRRHGVNAIFPFIVGFPGESDAERPGLARRGQAPAVHVARLRDADLLLQALPRLRPHGRRRPRRLRPPSHPGRLGPLRLHRLRRPLGEPRDATASSSASSSTSASPGTGPPPGSAPSRPSPAGA